MGRRGGGRVGGGGRSFGGGGSRGFGGRIGGGSISRGGGISRGISKGSSLNRGSSSSRSGSRGLSGGFSSRPSRPVYRSRPFFGGTNRTATGGGGGCSGCLALPVIILLVVILVIGIIVVAATSGDGNITKSTVRREPLPKGSVVETEYYTDELNWIGNSTKLEAGMKNFYKRTGVQPHLYITNNINGSKEPSQEEVQEFAFALYDDLFRDEAHLLLIFFEYQDYEYATWYVTGNQAKTVIDTEAADILLDYIDRYYYYDMTDEEFFSTAFDKAGKRIMTVTRSPWIPALITIGVLAILLIIFVWWKKAQDQKRKEAEETEKILNTPLETFGESKVDELAEKYKDDSVGIDLEDNDDNNENKNQSNDDYEGENTDK